MINFPETLTCQRYATCKLSFCGRERMRYIYGLYDHRTQDIFYVGSAFNVAQRFSEHLHNHPYVQAMLARGRFPLCFVLLEFTTICDRYSRRIEHDVAVFLRAQGHSAFSDDTKCTHTTDHWFYEMMEEQVHQLSALRDMWFDPCKG